MAAAATGPALDDRPAEQEQSRRGRRLSPGQSFLCDLLRYVGALMVVVSHALTFLYDAWYAPLRSYFFFNLGSMGVAVFFLLSGFLISYTISRKLEEDAQYGVEIYLVERFARIYVVYLPALVVIAGLCLLRIQIGDTDLPGLTLRHFVLTLVMLSGIEPYLPHGETFALATPAWTLNYEFFFYVLYGILVVPRARLRSWAWIAAVLFVFVLSLTSSLRLVRLLGYNWLLGVLVAQVFRMRTGRAGRAALLTLGVGWLVLVGRFAIGRAETTGAIDADPWFVTTAMAALLLIGLEMSDRWRLSDRVQRATAFLASFSYSLYMLHYAVLSTTLVALYVAGLYAASYTGAQRAAVFGASLVVANVFAWLFSLGTERHTQRLRRALVRALGLGRPAGGPLS